MTPPKRLAWPASPAWPRRSRHAPGIALTLITACALAARLWRLSQAPNTLNTDEIVALQLVSRILSGHGPGPLALDANGQPALSGYIQAASLYLFGASVWALRLPAALLGTLAIPLFYLVARRFTRPWPALGATTLLASSVYSLSLSRSGWINDYALPAELLALWFLIESVRRRHITFLCLSALACAAAGYGYAPFRLLPVGFLPLLVMNAIARRRNLRLAIAWLSVYLLGSLPLWASLAAQHAAVAQYVAAHRINSQLQDYPPGMAPIEVLALQTWKVVVGLVLLIPSPVSGLDLQHAPPGSWLIDGIGTLLYWVGLWRLGDHENPDATDVHGSCVSARALWWWLLVVPVLVAEVPVRDSPSLHPAVAAFPIYFLVVALGLCYASERLGRYRRALILLVVWSTLSSVAAYAHWVNSADATQARHKVGYTICYPSAHLLQHPCRDKSGQER